MNKFKIGDKVRLLKSQSVAINSETGVPFKKEDITTITDFLEYNNNPSLTFVRLGEGKDGRINIVSLDDLELVEEDNKVYTEEDIYEGMVLELVDEDNKVYTEEDIYEGMVLECVENNTPFWTVGKQYIVDNKLCIYDDDNWYWIVGKIVNFLNNDDFKVLEPEEQVIDDKLTHLNSIVMTVPKKDASGSYVNYKWLLDTLSTNNLIVNLSKSDRLVNVDESVVYINFEVLHEDLVHLAKSMSFPIKALRNLNQTKLELKLNGQHFILDIQEEMDYSTTLINGLIGNV